jgi:hypothetical protein
MTKVSTSARLVRETIIAMLAIACLVLGGCGGGSGSTPPPASGGPTPPAPAEIDGIATPTSVAVVTATHAQ